MKELEVDITTNGFALVDPQSLEAFHNGIKPLTNLLERYVTTDEGEAVVLAGAMVPIFNIPSFKYSFIIRRSDEVSSFDKDVWKSNAYYPFEVQKSAYLVDLGIFLSWNHNIFNNLQPLDIKPGMFAISVNLFTRRHLNNSVEKAGYILEFSEQRKLLPLSADMSENMTL